MVHKQRPPEPLSPKPFFGNPALSNQPGATPREHVTRNPFRTTDV